MSTATDLLLRAFIDAFAKNDGYVSIRRRGASPGYAHIVPSPFDPNRRAHRLVALELYNGTVAVAEELRELVSATPRPALRIEEHELGYSAGPNYGRFKWAVSHQTILGKWGSEKAFADELYACLRNLGVAAVEAGDEGDYQ